MTSTAVVTGTLPLRCWRGWQCRCGQVVHRLPAYGLGLVVRLHPGRDLPSGRRRSSAGPAARTTATAEASRNEVVDLAGLHQTFKGLQGYGVVGAQVSPDRHDGVSRRELEGSGLGGG